MLRYVYYLTQKLQICSFTLVGHHTLELHSFSIILSTYELYNLWQK